MSSDSKAESEESQSQKVLVLDTETTGKNFDVQIQIIQLAWGWWDGKEGISNLKSFTCMPTINWQSEWHEEHNLTMEDVEGAPPLENQIQDFIDDAMIADAVMGYNVDFDLSVLELEMERLGLDYTCITTKPFIDPMIVWNKSEGRKLVDAYRRWMGTELEEAHDAEADIGATVKVLSGMRSEFGLENVDNEELFSLCGPEPDDVDRTGKMKWLDGDIILTFGKYKYHGDGENKNVPGRTLFQVTKSNIWYAQNYPTFPTVHRSVSIAFRLALANISDREAFIQEMIAEFGPPSEHKDDVPDDDEVAAVLKEMQGWSFTFSQERVNEIASFCNDFTESGFSQESPFDWISDITFVDTDMGGDEWIKKYGPERFAVLSAIQIVFSQVTEQMNAMSACPECCSLSEDENGHLVCGEEGGKIEETGGGGEHWYWWRVGCNTCDFEWHNESDTI